MQNAMRIGRVGRVFKECVRKRPDGPTGNRLMSSLDEYDYELPRSLIAQHPLPRRADARLLVVDRATGTLQHYHIRDLPNLLRAGDSLVINDTRVIPARLVGFRAQTGGRWEGLFLSADDQGNWRLLAKTRGKLAARRANHAGQSSGCKRPCNCGCCSRKPEGAWIARPQAPGDPLALLDQVGRVPLPPYIRDGEMDAADRERYQTVFAQSPGAVAAPTAGLHFTDELLKRIEAARRGGRARHAARRARYVSAGHRVDDWPSTRCTANGAASRGDAVAAIERGKAAGGRTIAVGTTAVRVLETAAQGGALAPFEGPTDLFIRPPYQFRAVDGLLTNFHLPRTTLLVLVRTFGGDELIRRAYDEAIREEYRFLQLRRRDADSVN